MTMPSNDTNPARAPLRGQIEDIIVDTTLHPVAASLQIMQLFEADKAAAVREAYDLLYWKYKELNGQSVDMKFVDAYNALVGELRADPPHPTSTGEDTSDTESYRKGYNDNARDCFCDAFPLTPHRHLMDDGESHDIRPDIIKES